MDVDNHISSKLHIQYKVILDLFDSFLLLPGLPLRTTVRHGFWKTQSPGSRDDESESGALASMEGRDRVGAWGKTTRWMFGNTFWYLHSHGKSPSLT